MVTPSEKVVEALRASLVENTRLKRLNQQLAGRSRQPVAVVGLACRFPGGADTPARFWQNLLDGADGTSDVPAERWDMDLYHHPRKGMPGKSYTRRGAFISDLAGWDAAFFGATPQEALRLDPQHRQILELAWEALEEAGIPAERVKGSRTGVFLGLGDSQQYINLQYEAEGAACADDPLFSLGTSTSAAAGRVAHHLDARGPCISVDTACSSALTATHLAVQSLRSGECDLAIVGTASALMSPGAFVQACIMSMLAADGRTKTFDAAADGYVMGEGCGVVVLQRADQAAAEGRPAHAVIRGSAITQDGRSNGLTAPSRQAQVAVIREALADAGLSPGEVAFVEAHGSGTSLGDAIEFSSLTEVFGDRDAEQPLVVGAVKTNVGHLLTAAGMAGLVKTVLAVENGELPGNLHFSEPNSVVTLDGPVRPQLGRRPFPGAVRRAGVSSFGWSGTNVHLIVEQAAQAPTSPAPADEQLLTLSAAGPASLAEAADALAEHLERHPGLALADVAFTTRTGRSRLGFRRAVVAADVPDAVARLRDTGRTAVIANARRRVGLVLPDGEAATGSVRGLYESEPAFRAAYDECRERPSTFALGYGLVKLLEAYGVRPAVVYGRGPGRYVAGAAAGVFGLADAMALAADPATAGVRYAEPRMSLISAVTGAALAPAEATHPDHWTRPDGAPIATGLLARYADLVIDLGSTGPATALPVVRLDLGQDQDVDRRAWLSALAELWEHGPAIAWPAGGNLLRLPTYRFQRTRYWPAAAASDAPALSSDRGTRFLARTWRRDDARPPVPDRGTVLLLAADGDLRRAFTELAEAEGHQVVAARPEDSAEHLTGNPLRIVHADASDRGFYSLLELVQSLGRLPGEHPIELVVALSQTFDVLGGEPVRPMQATLTGLCRSIPDEYPRIRVTCVDLEGAAEPGDHAAHLLRELAHPGVAGLTAWRRGRRWLPSLDAVEAAPVADDQVFPAGGAYVITGGTAGLGFALARRLAPQRSRLALVSRTELPPPADRDAWMREHGSADRISRILLGVEQLQAAGAQVLTVRADVSNPDDVDAAFRTVREEFGRINAVIHAAGVPGRGLLQSKTRAEAAAVLAPKVTGTLNLAAALRADPPDLLVLYSSAVTALGGIGEGDYGAANAFLDAFAAAEDGRGEVARRVVSAGWAPWQHDSWQADAYADAPELRDLVGRNRSDFGFTDDEGLDALGQIVAAGHPHLYVLNQPLPALAVALKQVPDVLTVAPRQRYPRPDLRVAFVTPRTATEIRVAEIWQQLLGVEQVGLHDPFFELGGSSLIGLAVVARLGTEFGRDLPAASLLEHPTVARLAAVIDESGSDAGPSPSGQQISDSTDRGQRRRDRAAAAPARRRRAAK